MESINLYLVGNYVDSPVCIRGPIGRQDLKIGLNTDAECLNSSQNNYNTTTSDRVAAAKSVKWFKCCMPSLVNDIFIFKLQLKYSSRMDLKYRLVDSYRN